MYGIKIGSAQGPYTGLVGIYVLNYEKYIKDQVNKANNYLGRIREEIRCSKCGNLVRVFKKE